MLTQKRIFCVHRGTGGGKGGKGQQYTEPPEQQQQQRGRHPPPEVLVGELETEKRHLTDLTDLTKELESDVR